MIYRNNNKTTKNIDLEGKNAQFKQYTSNNKILKKRIKAKNKREGGMVLHSLLWVFSISIIS
jgi:hypothetical protein